MSWLSGFDTYEPDIIYSAWERFKEALLAAEGVSPLLPERRNVSELVRKFFMNPGRGREVIGCKNIHIFEVFGYRNNEKTYAVAKIIYTFILAEGNRKFTFDDFLDCQINNFEIIKYLNGG